MRCYWPWWCKPCNTTTRLLSYKEHNCSQIMIRILMTCKQCFGTAFRNGIEFGRNLRFEFWWDANNIVYLSEVLSFGVLKGTLCLLSFYGTREVESFKLHIHIMFWIGSTIIKLPSNFQNSYSLKSLVNTELLLKGWSNKSRWINDF